jgi:hypothetical protein
VLPLRELARRRVRIPLGDDVYEPSLAWHVAALLVVACAVGLVAVAFALELASSHPSSTAPLLLPFMALYTGAALAGLALLDLGARWILRRIRGPSGR